MTVGADRLTGFTPDRIVAERVHELVLDHPWLAEVGRVLDDVLEPTVLRVGLVAVAVVVAVARVRRPVPIAVTVVLALALGYAVAWGKARIDRPRPVWAEPVVEIGGSSMPSLHAFNAALLIGLAWMLVSPWFIERPRARRVVLTAVVVLIALAGVDRVILGVHYPSDVVAGWALGGVCVLVVGRTLFGSADRPRGQHPVGLR